MGIRCTTVAPETTISGPKREQKEDVTFRLSFWEKASFFFNNNPKRAINITF